MTEKSSLVECYIQPRGDEGLFTISANGDVSVRLHRYVIVPKESDAGKAALAAAGGLIFPRGSAYPIREAGFIARKRGDLSGTCLTWREWQQAQGLIGKMLTQGTARMLLRRGFTLMLAKDFYLEENDMKLLDLWHDAGVRQ